MKNSKKYHPGIPKMVEYLQEGKISRREFVRNAALLGMSAVAPASWPD